MNRTLKMRESLLVDDTACSAAETEALLDNADLLLCMLEQLKVEYIFGVPGGAIEPLYDALARSARRGGTRAVVARHESGAAFMADGYARQSGRLGVCCATTGPGTTNLITGVASAYANNIPLLVLSAQTAITDFGRGSFQESSGDGIDTVAMLAHCTRYNTLISHPGQFRFKLFSAIKAALEPSMRGPVHLSVPLDVFRTPLNPQSTRNTPSLALATPSLVDAQAVESLCQQLKAGRGALFVLGEGAAAAIDDILELAQRLSARVVVTPHASGLVPAQHPLYRGVFGFAGHDSARQALEDPEVDTVVVVGSGLGEWASGGWFPALFDPARLVHVDAAVENLRRTPMARLQVQGDPGVIFAGVLDAIAAPLEVMPGQGGKRQYESWHDSSPGNTATPMFPYDNPASVRDDSAPIKPQRLMHLLPGLFPPGTRYLADVGTSMAWAIHYLHPVQAMAGPEQDACRGGLWVALEFAAMGWAVGAAVGAGLCANAGPVVCITGDGSVLMNGQEITVAVQESLPIVFIVLNDAALGMVRQGQQMAHAEAVGFALPEIDFSAYAQALGARGHVIHSVEDLLALDIDDILNSAGPTVLDVRIDRNELAPIQTRVKTLTEMH